jgi:hypothetical protein
LPRGITNIVTCNWKGYYGYFVLSCWRGIW